MSSTYTTSKHYFGSGTPYYYGKMTLTKSTYNASVKVSWKVELIQKYGSEYGVAVKMSGADSGSASGYATSVQSYERTICSKSGSITFDRTTSSQTKTFKITAYGKTVDGKWSAGGEVSKSASVSIPELDSYAIKYNANGGSGVPSSQTKYYGKNLTLSSTKPTRTGYTFVKWNTKSDGSGTNYSPGASYTNNAAVTLYAIWKINTYSVSYNANGGSGAPAQQTKTYGVNLTLSTTRPTRTGYTFSKWNTKSDGSGTSYNPGASYTSNAAVTLYAIWTLNTYVVMYDGNGESDPVSGVPGQQTKYYGTALTLSTSKPTRTGWVFKGWATTRNGSVSYQPGSSYTGNAVLNLYAVWVVDYKRPTITDVAKPYRVVYNEDTGTYDQDDEGTYAYIGFSWAIDSAHASNPTVAIDAKARTDSSWQTIATPSISGGSGTVILPNVSYPSTGFVKENTYDIRITVSDSGGSTSVSTFLSQAFFTMDFKNGGKGIAFGAPAMEDGFTCAMDTNFTGNFKIKNKTIFDLIYPVGSIYLSTVNTSPATLFGGTWVQIENRFLLAAGSSYAAGATGGSANAVVPYHRHSVTAVSDGITGGAHSHKSSTTTEYFVTSEASGAYNAGFTAGASGQSRRVDAPEASSSIFHHRANTNSPTHTHDLPAHNTDYIGTSGNTTGANMPPYLAVYVWKRTE